MFFLRLQKSELYLPDLKTFWIGTFNIFGSDFQIPPPDGNHFSIGTNGFAFDVVY